MDIIISGLIAGLMTCAAFILLIEKAGPTLQALLIGHYLLTDIVGTFIAYSFMPVIGLATLVSAASFCLIFTSYLHYKRRTIQWITIKDLILKRK